MLMFNLWCIRNLWWALPRPTARDSLFLSRGWQAPEFEAIRSLAFAALPGTVQCQICYFASREPSGSGLLIFMFAGL
jgi:hypothetical protein